MLSRTHTFPANHIPQLKKQGKTTHTAIGLLVFLPNTLKSFRVTCIISKKITPLANRRNLLNRRLLHAFRQTIPLDTSLDLLIFPYKKTLQLPYSQIEAIIKTWYNSQI